MYDTLNFIIVRLLRLLGKMDSSPERYAEENAFLENILNREAGIDSDSGNYHNDPQDPHAAGILAAKRAQEFKRDPNYVPSVEVWA